MDEREAKKRVFDRKKPPCKHPVKAFSTPNLQKCKSEKSLGERAFCLPKAPLFDPVFEGRVSGAAQAVDYQLNTD